MNVPDARAWLRIIVHAPVENWPDNSDLKVLIGEMQHAASQALGAARGA